MTTSILQSRKLVSTQSTSNIQYVHSYHDEEKQSLVEHLNFLLKNDKSLKSVLPIDPKSDLIFDSLKDGIILCKLINSIKPKTINETRLKLNITSTLNIFEKNVNLESCLRGAKHIGCSIVNIGPVDFQEGKRHLILSVLWQLVKIDLLNKVSKLAYRVKAEMLDLGETEKIEELVADEILVRWVNHHLAESGSDRRVTNFSSDIKDCVVYIQLFNQLSPSTCGLELLNIMDLTDRSKQFLESIDRIDCKKFISYQDIVVGNGRLNIAFIAYIFNRFNQVEPVVPSMEMSRVAEEKIGADQHIVEKLDDEIARYQNRHFESNQVYEEIVKRIELTRQQDVELELEFQEKSEIIQLEFQQQKSEYEERIEKLQKQLELIEQVQLPQETELVELLELEKQEIQLLQQELQSTIENELSEIREQTISNQIEMDKLKANQESSQAELAEIKEKLNAEKNEVLAKLESTGLLETKRTLEQVITTTKTLETEIHTLKSEEKQLKNVLVETKEDKQRISLAKKKIQDELTRAKDNTEKMIKTKFETDKIIDKTTRQVKDIRYEIDRIQNDKIYIAQQTEVIKIETIEVTNDLEQMIVDKKRLTSKKQEISTTLFEKELELDQVLVEKEIKVENVKSTSRETIQKMKREFEITKNEINDEKERVRQQVLQSQAQLERQEIAAENERIQLELQSNRAKSIKDDIQRAQIEKEETEKEMKKITKDKSKTNVLLDQEKEINKLLSNKNSELYKEKSVLREKKTAAAIEAKLVEKQSKELEEQVDQLNTEIDETLIAKQKIELLSIEDSAELESKKLEIREEKRRLKKMKSAKQLEEKETLDQLTNKLEKDLSRVVSQHESIEKDIQEKKFQQDDLELKEKRQADRLAKAEKEIINKKQQLEKKERENSKIQQEKQKLESILNQARDVISDIKKEKDSTAKDREIITNKHKILLENYGATTKTKKSLEQSKKELEDKMNKLAALKSENELQHKKKVHELQLKSRDELDKQKQQFEKDQQKLAEKLERQLNEDQENFVKKNESQIAKTLESIQRNKDEAARVEEKIQQEKENHQLELEKKKRRDEREKKKLKDKFDQEN